MARYIVGRLVSIVLVLLAVSAITFLMMHAVPGGPFDETKRALSDEAKGNVRRMYGLDKPLYVQYLRFVYNAARLNFGYSYQFPGETIAQVFGRTWQPTVIIGVCTLVVAIVFGVILGVASAYAQNTWLDYLLTFGTTLGLVIPAFVLVVGLIVLFSRVLRWLPSGGWGRPEQLILPLLGNSLGSTCFVARFTRSSVLEVMHREYVRTAKAKGVSGLRLATKHVLRNALTPLVTVFGPMLPGIVTNSVFVESMFRVPGMGTFFVNAVGFRDYPMILATTTLIAFLVGIANLLTDIAYTWVDPRVRLESTRR
jgi:ABC-type dipeptide/oligopeptide/nickel transport system permease component